MNRGKARRHIPISVVAGLLLFTLSCITAEEAKNEALKVDIKSAKARYELACQTGNTIAQLLSVAITNAQKAGGPIAIIERWSRNASEAEKKRVDGLKGNLTKYKEANDNLSTLFSMQLSDLSQLEKLTAASKTLLDLRNRFDLDIDYYYFKIRDSEAMEGYEKDSVESLKLDTIHLMNNLAATLNYATEGLGEYLALRKHEK